VVKCLLDDSAVLDCLLENGIDEGKAKYHMNKLINAVAREEEKVWERLEKEQACKQDKDTDPLEACTNLSEFDITTQREIPSSFYAILKDWKITTSKLVHVSESTDYVTTKLLIELESGNQIEAVVLRHNKRTTLCVSSQVGCKMGCTFCATGTLGQKENLSAGEILEQVVHANRFLKTSAEPRTVSNIVFMGMGEPLNNYHAVVTACRAVNSRFGLQQHRLTVSTVGVVNRMKTLHEDLPGVSLALSLHAPNQELRKKIIPTAGAYPIPKLLEALETYLGQRKASTGKDAYVMIEYILLAGVNDMPEIAEELAQLLMPLKSQVKVNLIPYNPIFNPEGLAKTFVQPSEEAQVRFKSILQDRHGIFCTIRTEMGQDVNGACGQLACISKEAREGGVDIEDLYRNRQHDDLYNKQTGENIRKKKATAQLKFRKRKQAACGSQQSILDTLRQGVTENPLLATGVLAAVFASLAVITIRGMRSN